MSTLIFVTYLLQPLPVLQVCKLSQPETLNSGGPSNSYRYRVFVTGIAGREIVRALGLLRSRTMKHHTRSITRQGRNRLRRHNAILLTETPPIADVPAAIGRG
ncbi:hypothetical protein N7G274_007835 [Stereocaulon virgatum]|uniref:Secreted protein n=1 Tax=Stereocaulon virgatum TaxID=373712 RepID=A0ABR4A8A5_9LECA